MPCQTVTANMKSSTEICRKPGKLASMRSLAFVDALRARIAAAAFNPSDMSTTNCCGNSGRNKARNRMMPLSPGIILPFTTRSQHLIGSSTVSLKCSIVSNAISPSRRSVRAHSGKERRSRNRSRMMHIAVTVVVTCRIRQAIGLGHIITYLIGRGVI